MGSSETGAIEKIYCNTCRNTTKHELIFAHERESADVDFMADPLGNAGEYQQWTYRLWVCCGCETPTLQEQSVSYISNLEEVPEEVFYPKRTRRTLSLKVFRQLDEKLSRIYREIIESYNNQARILCAIGLRALLEGICAEKKIKGRNLYQKIDGLTAANLPKNIVESLHKFRFIGNEAAHELQHPQELELRLAIEVIEDLLNFMYELDYKARSLFEGSYLSPPSSEHPRHEVLKRLIERHPPIPKGQKELYKALYEAGDKGLSIAQIAKEMGRTERQIYGVLGALGRRINNTVGVEGMPGVGLIFDLVQETDSGEDKSWGWKMRPELREVLSSENYPWIQT